MNAPSSNEGIVFSISGCLLVWLEVRFEKHSNSMCLNIGKLVVVAIFAMTVAVFFTSYDFKMMCYFICGSAGFESLLKIIQVMIDGKKS